MDTPKKEIPKETPKDTPKREERIVRKSSGGDIKLIWVNTSVTDENSLYIDLLKGIKKDVLQHQM